MPPRLPCAQINNDNPVATFLRRICNIRYTLARRSYRRAQIEAHVVDITVCVYYIRRENNRLKDGIVAQVYTNELRPADAGGDIGPILHCGSPRVEDPEPVQRVNDDGLDADEVVFVVGAAGGRGAVIYSAAGGRVDFGSGVGHFGCVRVEFGNCVGYVVWVKGAGVVGENSAGGGDGDA